MNLGQMKTILRNRLGRANEDADNIKIWLNMAKDEIARERNWSFLKTEQQATTIANVRSYTFPANFKDEVNLFIQVDGKLKSLVSASLLQMADKYTDTETGQPKFWVQQGSSFQLWPLPDDVYTLIFEGEVIPPDFEDDEDSNVISLNLPDVLLANATARGFANYEQFDKATYWQNEYRKQLIAQWAIDVERQLPGELMLRPRVNAGTSMAVREWF